jgi:hypothetical protein
MRQQPSDTPLTSVIDGILRVNCLCDAEMSAVNDGKTDTTLILLSWTDDARLMVRHHPANQEMHPSP